MVVSARGGGAKSKAVSSKTKEKPSVVKSVKGKNCIKEVKTVKRVAKTNSPKPSASTSNGIDKHKVTKKTKPKPAVSLPVKKTATVSVKSTNGTKGGEASKVKKAESKSRSSSPAVGLGKSISTGTKGAIKSSTKTAFAVKPPTPSPKTKIVR